MMDDDNNNMMYQYLVVDSGPIIRRTALTTLWKKARAFYTVPAVLEEIRDAKAREHLEQLPFELKTQTPSAQALQAVAEFSRQTGDHHSLSVVDLQVLALLYDLEQQAAGGDMSHVRTTPKRTVGVGKIQLLGHGENSKQASEDVVDDGDYDVVEDEDGEEEEEGDKDDGTRDDQHQNQPTDDTTSEEQQQPQQQQQATSTTKPKSWAMLVNPTQASTSLPQVPNKTAEPNPFSSNTPVAGGDAVVDEHQGGGQFSDAEEEEESDEEFDPEQEISDEDCDVYIRDPHELAEDNQTATAGVAADEQRAALEADLQSEFPSLAAASLVPYEGSDDEQEEDVATTAADDETKANHDKELEARRKADEERKQKSLQPVSKSGKLYNSFRQYKDLMKPKPVEKKVVTTPVAEIEPQDEEDPEAEANNNNNKNESRIIGGMTLAGQDGDVEDDGEGWITCTKDIRAMKNAGALDPKQDPHNLNQNQRDENRGPPISQRAACATTDFAMQNVILQMNLELLSVDGIKVRKLKTWVTRCGACYKVYTSNENVGPLGTKRLFCERCGSDMMQRIAASVDGKTGRLRLHLSKKYKHNLRGTKFSLPKPGTGNRFQGDLLLREDQLMTGAWNQKVKMRSGGKARRSAESIFGADIASNVGCHKSGSMSSDIRVGFGRRNPNAAKGRERRGKKKKSSDKACGLRRY